MGAVDVCIAVRLILDEARDRHFVEDGAEHLVFRHLAFQSGFALLEIGDIDPQTQCAAIVE